MGARHRSSAIGRRSQRVARPSPHREPRPSDRDTQRAPLARRLPRWRMEAEQVEDPRLVRDPIQARREVVGVADGEAAGVRSQALGACRVVDVLLDERRHHAGRVWRPRDLRRVAGGRQQAAHVEEVDGNVRVVRDPSGFPQLIPQLRIRVLDEALRDEQKGLAATNVREGLQLPAQGGVGETHPIATSSLDLLGDGPVPARLSLHDAMRLILGHGAERTNALHLLPSFRPRVVGEHLFPSHLGRSTAAETGDDRQQVLTPFRDARAPADVTARAREPHLVAVADRACQERRQCLTHSRAIELRNPDVVQEDGVRAAWTRGRAIGDDGG